MGLTIRSALSVASCVCHKMELLQRQTENLYQHAPVSPISGFKKKMLKTDHNAEPYSNTGIAYVSNNFKSNLEFTDSVETFVLS